MYNYFRFPLVPDGAVDEVPEAEWCRGHPDLHLRGHQERHQGPQQGHHQQGVQVDTLHANKQMITLHYKIYTSNALLFVSCLYNV